MGPFKIFIVEDDLMYGELLEAHLTFEPEYEVYRFTTGEACLAALEKEPGLVSVDFALPDMNGSELLRKIKEYRADIPVFIISGQEDVAIAIELLKQGASDYFVKNENTAELLSNAVKRTREYLVLKNEVEMLKDELSRKYKIKSALLGNSAMMLHVHAQVETVAKNRDCALVLGETGSGKKVVAKAIHYNSPRMKGPFVEVNAGIIPREYLENELFGYEKGAFPEAISRKIGKIEEAAHGTLFICDINELDMGLQGKLLKVLRDKQFVRIGGKEPLKADIHFICSASKSLEKEVISGNFREDLHKYIVDNTIDLPPLRERGSDIILLANHFLDEYCNANGMGRMTLSLPAKEKLLKYYYPGNVRELKAIIELSAITSYGQQIYQEDIHFVNFPVDDPFLDSEKTMKEYTSEIIKFYLKKYENNVIKVAEKLDIGKSTVYRFIHKKEIRASNMLK